MIFPPHPDKNVQMEVDRWLSGAWNNVVAKPLNGLAEKTGSSLRLPIWNVPSFDEVKRLQKMGRHP